MLYPTIFAIQRHELGGDFVDGVKEPNTVAVCRFVFKGTNGNGMLGDWEVRLNMEVHGMEEV